MLTVDLEYIMRNFICHRFGGNFLFLFVFYFLFFETLFWGRSWIKPFMRIKCKHVWKEKWSLMIGLVFFFQGIHWDRTVILSYSVRGTMLLVYFSFLKISLQIYHENLFFMSYKIKLIKDIVYVVCIYLLSFCKRRMI